MAFRTKERTIMILVKHVMVSRMPGSTERIVMSKTIFNVLVISKGFSLLSRLTVSFSGPPEVDEDGLAASHTELQLNNIT
ncbi:MAG TPA: hypothetical protein VI387_10145, partial [Candidatus Brocadiales bacterium]|nr:hypothetical protein [Candidatus Brocadiales bacterium]